MNNKILVISGPTSSGKSSLALEVAKNIDSIIINSDSIQLYKELPILSAQPSKNELSQSEHALYSILNYTDKSSLNNWLNLAKEEIDRAFKNNKLPILVGGTGMYISKLIDGINEIPQINEETKEYSLEIFSKSGIFGLRSELLNLGDKEEKVINLDKQRLMRRLEILKQTKKTMDYWQSLPIKKFYDKKQFVHVNINPDREMLYEACNHRFEAMLNLGAIEEVKEFLKLKPDPSLPIFKTIGLLEIRDYLNGDLNKDELIKISAQKTRNYAKRQLTWFRNQFKDKIEVTNVSHETITNIMKQL